MKQLKKATIAALAVLCTTFMANSQEAYPSKPVTIVVPYAAGGNTDLLARMVAEGLSAELKQTFLIENKPGASTSIGAEQVARSKADGYTLFVAQFSSHASNQWMLPNLRYDPVKDFRAVSMLAETPFFLLVNSNSPIHTTQELVDYAKNKGTVIFGHAGGPLQIAGELFKKETGINMRAVPYKGSAPMATDLLGGTLEFVFDATAMSFVKTGELRALAIAAKDRWPSEPDVPSIAEQGYPEIEIKGFFALVAPTGTPDDVVETLNKAVNAYLQRQEVIDRMRSMNLEPLPVTPEEADAYLLDQSTRWKDLIQAAGMTAN